MSKPKRSNQQEPSQEELDAIETSEYIEETSGYHSDDLQQYLPF
jgi:hypothetical protein